MSANVPSGIVTFLFTDIEGSTNLWQEKPEAMAHAHARHDAILRTAIVANHGFILDIVGDAFSAAFHNTSDGLHAALAAQRALQSEPWGETGAIRVRMGLHTGAAEFASDGSNKYHDGYATLASTQRVMSAAHGGQVLVSNTTHDLLQDDQLDKATLRDMGEHRLKDLRAPLRLYQLTAAGLARDFPPIKSLDLLPNNLPIQLTHFVGREKELAEVGRLLSGTRLLTLTGSGGTGKTRLVLQAAAAVLEDFPQGVWLVELAPVTDPLIVAQSVASVLAVREMSGRTLQDALIDFLRYKTLLLVLDNCEHLIAACARLADDLLHACPGLKILASSREALGISGEVNYRVPSLSLPGADLKPGKASPADLEGSEAVRLFVERARAVAPAFCLDSGNAFAVAQICRRLDGIPLAIELAAARLKALTPAQIAARLDDSFRLLTGGSRTALPRQQTLKALIDWSWALLSPSEKTLLRRLAVFSGGFTLEAVEEICADLDPAAPDQVSLSDFEILDLLEGLVNKSLIQAGEQAERARYRLLATIRQYALDQLVQSGEAPGLRDRHLAFFSHLAQDAGKRLNGPEMIASIDILEQDGDNLRAALEWGLASCSPVALAMAKSLLLYWSECGLDTEGLRWLNMAAECLPPPAPGEGEADPGVDARQRQATHAYLLGGTTMLTGNLGYNLAAIKFGQEAECWARASGDPGALCYALASKALGMSFVQDYFTQSKAAVDESFALALQIGDLWLQGLILSVATNVAHISGDLLAAQRFQKDQSNLARQTGNPWLIAMGVYGLLIVSQAQGEGDLGDIRREVEEGVRLFASLKSFGFIAALRSELGHMLRHRGELAEAQAIYLETIPQWLELGNQAAVAHQFECLACLAVSLRQPQRAARLLGAAQALRSHLHSDMSPHERPDYAVTLSAVRDSLDAAVFEAAWNAGEALNLEQAVAYALEPNS